MKKTVLLIFALNLSFVFAQEAKEEETDSIGTYQFLEEEIGRASCRERV